MRTVHRPPVVFGQDQIAKSYMHAMKSKKPLLLAAAIAGLYVGSATAHAAVLDSSPIVAGEKEKGSCKGKESCKSKEACKGKESCKAKPAPTPAPSSQVACDKDKGSGADKTKQA